MTTIKTVKPKSVKPKVSTPKSEPALKAPSLMPISFKDFSKDPVKGLLFIVLIAIGYLYVDGKMNYTNQIETQAKKIEALETRVENLGNQLRKSDSTLAAAESKIAVLQQLGKIK
jgi:prefoldin subunit 5